MNIHMSPALQSFNFENNAVRVIMREDNPWFVAADVCRALDIANSRDALDKLDEDEKDVGLTDTLGGRQQMSIISESGLYALILRCRDAMTVGTLAHRFRKFVTAEVLPAIRRYGSYNAPYPMDEDVRAWNVPLPKLNTIANMMRAVQNSHGPEAARKLYSMEKTLPRLGRVTVGELTGTVGDDPEGCLKHLLRQSNGKGMALKNLYTLALHDKVAAQQLTDFGIMLGGVGNKFTFIAKTHPFLSKIYADTQWCGNWVKALSKLKGAEASSIKIRFTAHGSAALMLPQETVFGILNPTLA
jgi:prophage antirepressor-like protein